MTDNEELEVPINDENDGESFADLFEQSAQRTNWLEPGQKLTARVLKVSAEWIFIDTGQKGEGVVDRKEFLDLDGNVTIKEGETISAYFLSSSHGEMRFTTRIGGGGASGSSQLEDAWRSGVPVEGLVEKEIKGGFEIRLGGNARAFCPFSQIALRRMDSTE
jgi:small subunit ribosomal protein S1